MILQKTYTRPNPNPVARTAPNRPTSESKDAYEPSGPAANPPFVNPQKLTKPMAPAPGPNPNRLQQFAGMSQTDLNVLYLNSQAGSIPHGEGTGRAMFFPDCGHEPVLANLAGHIWQGKIFNEDGNGLTNRVFGHRFGPAQVFRGPSLLDGKEAIVLDYCKSNPLLTSIRDEIRQVEPGLYLGRAYIRTPLGSVLATNFALDFGNTSTGT